MGHTGEMLFAGTGSGTAAELTVRESRKIGKGKTGIVPNAVAGMAGSHVSRKNWLRRL